MAEKFVDLKPTIAKDTVASPSSLRSEYQAEALKWLDEHPDQVPGRTITQSRYAAEKKDRSLTYMQGFHSAMVEFGGAVIPDPEPTNAEKLAEVLRGSFNDFKFDLEASFEDMARALDEAGVKAPGGGDE